jgi:hypothetical protein
MENGKCMGSCDAGERTGVSGRVDAVEDYISPRPVARPRATIWAQVDRAVEAMCAGINEELGCALTRDAEESAEPDAGSEGG